MACTSTKYDEIEKKLLDPTVRPISLPLTYLEHITGNFSDEQELGRGTYGVVYKGVLRNRRFIAVKKLNDMHLVNDDQFQNEVRCLMEIKHQNVVQLKGYCAESSWKMIKLQSGERTMAQLPKRIICFEYISEKSLRCLISDESSGLDWCKRFEIIKEICNGLHFIHGESIVHLDLKPENILMDATMKPKIADFGLSRLLDAKGSHTTADGNLTGSLGYMAAEYYKGKFSTKTDIFSFGVIIIEIITGSRNYPLLYRLAQCKDFHSRQNIQIYIQQQHVENVLGRWRKIFDQKYPSPEIYTEQVKQCMAIALKCLDHDLERRPDAWDIMQMLCAVESSAKGEEKMQLDIHAKNDPSEQNIRVSRERLSSGEGSLTEPLSQSIAGEESDQNSVAANNIPEDVTAALVSPSQQQSVTPNKEQEEEWRILERQLHDPTARPHVFPLQYLENILSIEQTLGKGAYGVVYKGVLLTGGFIAVKKLHDKHILDDEQFQKEVNSLMEINHQNIVQLKGYCAESSWEMIKLESGEYTMVQLPKRMICFEYLCNKSLRDHISDKCSSLDWHKGFEIIKEICSGLHFLHVNHIGHRDIKPENILMDATMKPKIADFGLSKLLDAEESVTMGNIAGTLGYMAPEYIDKGIFSTKADIFSFGVIIIEIITGGKDHSVLYNVTRCKDFHSRQEIEKYVKPFIEKMLERWREIFEPKYASLEKYADQARQCMAIAVKCLENDSERRPNAWEIFQMLCAVESTNLTAEDIKDPLVYQEAGEFLNAQPVLIGFPLEPETSCSSCSLHLINRTSHCVAFRIWTKSKNMSFVRPLCGLVHAGERNTLHVEVKVCKPLHNEFFTLESTIVLPDSKTTDCACHYYDRFFRKAVKEGRKVQQVILSAVFVCQAQGEQNMLLNMQAENEPSELPPDEGSLAEPREGCIGWICSVLKRWSCRAQDDTGTAAMVR